MKPRPPTDVASEVCSLPQSRPAVQWAGLYPVLIFFATFALLWPTTRSLLSEWRDDSNTTTYTHGFLIAAVSAWLLFRARHDFQRDARKSNVIAAIALCGAGIAWLVALRAGIQTVHQILLPLMMWLAVCAALGLRAGLHAAFAIGYLYFAIPVWGHVNDLLQNATVVVVELLLRLSGVTAYVEGNFVHLVSGVIEIAHGCSGLHYFIVALAIGALYGEIHRDPLKIRAFQMALAFMLALATNWIRVYIIILAGYLTDMQHYLVTESHYTFGWCVFAAAMVLYFLVVRKLPVVDPPPSESIDGSQSVSQSAAGRSFGMVVALACLSLAPVWNAVRPASAGNLPIAVEMLPSELETWRGPGRVVTPEWSPTFVGADATAHGIYDGDDARVEVFVATYAAQSQGKELIGYKNSIVDSRVETVVDRSRASFPTPMKELIVNRAPDRRFVIWYSYRIGSWETDREVVAQASYGLLSLAGAAPASVVAIRAACTEDCQSARNSLRDFAIEAKL